MLQWFVPPLSVPIADLMNRLLVTNKGGEWKFFSYGISAAHIQITRVYDLRSSEG